jgi:hypothetical protein
MNPISIGVGGGGEYIRPTKIFLLSSAPASYREGTVREEAHILGSMKGYCLGLLVRVPKWSMHNGFGLQSAHGQFICWHNLFKHQKSLRHPFFTVTSALNLTLY